MIRLAISLCAAMVTWGACFQEAGAAIGTYSRLDREENATKSVFMIAPQKIPKMKQSVYPQRSVLIVNEPVPLFCRQPHILIMFVCPTVQFDNSATNMRRRPAVFSFPWKIFDDSVVYMNCDDLRWGPPVAFEGKKHAESIERNPNWTPFCRSEWRTDGQQFHFVQENHGHFNTDGNLGGSFRRVSSNLGSSKHSEGYPPKSPGKYGNSYSRYTRDSASILVSRDKAAGQMQLNPGDRFDENADFFMKCMVGLVVFILVYAICKRL